MSLTMDGSVMKPAQVKGLMRYFTFEQPLVWTNVIGMAGLHIAAVYTFICVIPFASYKTFMWGFILSYLGGLGVTAGVHRLWTHKTYKARVPLRIFLMVIYIFAGMYSIESWVRDHRTHHKYSDTDGDPHNSRRGFFFSHLGWLTMKRHPELKEKGKLIDISDLQQDSVVRFHQKHFYLLHFFIYWVFPTFVPMYFWNETFFNTVMEILITRYVVALNCIWTVNSIAHFYGTKPYNKNIRAVQNKFVAIIGQGEGWHNYHHVFPWDYRIGELGQKNQSGAAFIEFCERLGLAYDLKTAPPEMVAKVMAKNGGMMEGEEVPHPDDDIVKKKNLMNGSANIKEKQKGQ